MHALVGLLEFSQQLKMEALIPAPANCEVRSMIIFLNAQSIAPIEIHRQLCQVYGHTRLDGQHISCRSSAERCVITIHRMTRSSGPEIPIFSYTSRNSCPVSISVFRMTEKRRWMSKLVPIPGGRFLRHRIQKMVPRCDKCLNSRGEYVEKDLNTCCICSNKYFH